jgi:phosphoribosyl 1,2-cyclic phosphodiesterase
VRFASLGSGSRGNATLVEAGSTRLLVDCGYSRRELERRLALAGVDPESIDAILITHEHADHVKGVGAVARRYGLPVWCTRGTWRGFDMGEVVRLHLFTPQVDGFRIGGLQVRPYPVPHDAREPVQYVFEADRRRLGILTDTGSLTPHILERLDGVDALLLECNHDPGMLASGPYPPSLQARVGGALGHLSNGQAAQLLSRLEHSRLSHLVAAHLSEKNNRPDLAREAISSVCASLDDRLSVLAQSEVSDWFTV